MCDSLNHPSPAKTERPTGTHSRNHEFSLNFCGPRFIAIVFLTMCLLPLHADEKLVIDARETQFTKDLTVYKGNVRFFNQGNFLITADEARYSTSEGAAELVGNVKMDFFSGNGVIEIASQHVQYNFETSTGVFSDVEAQFGEDFHFTGKRIELHPGGRFLIYDGILTSCNQANPQWSVKLKKAILEQEGYSRLKHATFRIKGVPVFYFPYLILPTMQARRSGLLLPETGNSQRNGAYLKTPFYWAPRPDLDLTLTPGFFAESGISVDTEVRYHVRPETKGTFHGFYISDQVIKDSGPIYESGNQIKPDRYRYSFNHEQKTRAGALLINAEQGSDYQVEWNFVEDINSGRNRDFYYDLWYGRMWKEQFFSVDFMQNERIFVGGEHIGLIRKLPELTWVIPSRHLGAGIYLKSNMHLGFFEHNYDTQSESSPSLRYSLNSEIKRTARIGPYLFTNYGVSILTSRLKGATKSTDRNPFIAAGTFEAFGPKLHKTFHKRNIDHFISYGVSMRYNDIQDPLPDNSLLFDENDIFLGDQIQGLDTSWLVRSSFFSRNNKTSMPLLEIELRKKVNTETRKSPLEIAVRVPGFHGFHFNSLIKYRTDENQFELLSFYGSAVKKNWTGYAGYVKRQTGLNNQDSIILRSDLTVPNFKSRLQVAMDYDFQRNEFKSQELAYTIIGQCMSFKFAYLETPDAGTLGTKKWYRLILQFKNLGEIGSKL